MSVKYLIHRPGARIGEIADYLDRLEPDHRLHEVRGLDGRDQARLYELAGDGPPITLEHFVPPDRAALREVIHEGKNTLPVFQRFQKRMCRPETGTGRLFGYNEGATRSLLGPGYFVVHGTADHPDWHRRGAVVVDYFMVPDGPVAPAWPAVVPNSRGLQMLVYQGTRDFMRRVSAQVSVGAAYKGEKPLGAYFTLCRQD